LQLFAFTTYYWTHRPNGFPAHNYPDFPSDLSTIFLGAVCVFLIHLYLHYFKLCKDISYFYMSKLMGSRRARR
jgi:hypothetical protein